MDKNRRKFVKATGQTVLGLGISGMFTIPMIGCNSKPKNNEENSDRDEVISETDLFFRISLAQWSLHRQLRANEIDNLDFAGIAKNKFDIHAVEYVNQFFPDKANDTAYLTEMNTRADDNGVKNVLIMIDNEGNLAELEDEKRNQAVENHYKWVEAAKFLGCHAIRVNARSSAGTADEVMQSAIEGLGKLTEYGSRNGIEVIVENHGGYSSNGQWLSSVISQVNSNMCGTLPDFGNFCIERGKDDEGKPICVNEYDRYQGTRELMPYAKGVSAKSYSFTENGDESNMDYRKLLKIVKDAGFTGHIGIEFEGEGDSYEGIQATKDLLIKVGGELS